MEPNSNKWFEEVIHRYTTDEAVADGVLVRCGFVTVNDNELWPVYLTRTLFEDGFQDRSRQRDLIELGLRRLRQPDPEDSAWMRLRVLEKDKAWVIAEPGKLTYLKPEDY